MIEDLEKKIDKIQADLQLIKKATALFLRNIQYETNINKGMIYSTMGEAGDAAREIWKLREKLNGKV